MFFVSSLSLVGITLLILFVPCDSKHKEPIDAPIVESSAKTLPSGVDLMKGKELADDLLSLISTRFQVKDYNMKQFLVVVQNIPSHGWDLIKYKIARKILAGSSSFVMVFGGSSVTAGHDNYHLQSYPYIFEKRMRPIFEAVGVNLIVRNIAHGSSNCRPADYCYESMGGGQSDFILWEQSFNCGRDKGVFELMARVAYWQGAVLYYMASGGIIPNCPPSTDTIPWISEDWTPEKVNEHRIHPNMTLASVAKYRDLVNAWYNDGNAADKFSTGAYGPIYNGVGPHGFNFWGHSRSLCDKGKGCDAASKFGGCYADGGLHWQTAEASYYASDPHGRGKKWHPPAGMHLFRAEVMAYLYVHIIADAILQVHNDTMAVIHDAKVSNDKVDFSNLIKIYKNRIRKLRPEIPEEGVFNTPEESKYPPHCFTDFEPHYNPPQRLSAIIMGNSSDWTLVRTHTWSDSDDKYGYLDIKTYYETIGPRKEIHLQVKDVRMGAIRVCGYNRKESLKHVIFYLDPNYPFNNYDINDKEERRRRQLEELQQHHHENIQQFHDGGANGGQPVFGRSALEGTIPASAIPRLPEYIPTENRFKITERNYAQDECTRLYGLPNGDHVLTLQTDPNYLTHKASLSHVIVF